MRLPILFWIGSVVIALVHIALLVFLWCAWPSDEAIVRQSLGVVRIPPSYRGCGPVAVPVPVYRLGTDVVCFHTKVAHCAGDIVKSGDVIYERRTAVPGELMWCEGDNKYLDSREYYIRPEDRP